MGHVAREWLEKTGGSVVVFDVRGADCADTQGFFAPLLESGRLAVFVGDVGDAGAWERLVARGV